MKPKLFFVVICLFAGLLINSCGNDTSSTATPEDVKITIGETINISGFPLTDIVPPSVFDSVSAVLATVQTTQAVRNGDNLVTQVKTDIKGFFQYPGEVDYLKFDNQKLKLEQIFYHPYYNVPSGWTYYDYTFSIPVTWELKMHGSDALTIPYSTNKNMHKIFISTGDTLSVSKPFTITWQPAGDNEFLAINFSWKSMLADTVPTKQIKGLKNIPDNGRLDFAANDLQNYGIPNYGILYFNLIRYKAVSGKFDNNSKKYLLLSVLESSVYLSLKQ